MIAREVIFELPTFATYGDGIDLWGPICARLKVCNAAASASSNVCGDLIRECYVSTRLIRKLKMLPVRAPRFSISITVLLRDNFHIRDGYIARPFQLQSVCSCSFARSCARLHTRTCRNSRDRIYGAIRFDGGRLIDPISVCSSFVY